MNDTTNPRSPHPCATYEWCDGRGHINDGAYPEVHRHTTSYSSTFPAGLAEATTEPPVATAYFERADDWGNRLWVNFANASCDVPLDNVQEYCIELAAFVGGIEAFLTSTKNAMN